MVSPKAVKIIWAVDPFDSQAALDPSVVDAVRLVAKPQQAVIEPVYVLGRIDAGPELGVDYLVNLKPAAEAAMASLVRSIKLGSLISPTVLVQSATSLPRSVDHLCHYAESSGAQLIIVTTHARKGGIRLVLGSFSESLIARSPVDVLVAKRGGVPPSGAQKTILHSVDFGDGCEELFRSALALAKRLGMGLYLYHVAAPHSPFPIMVSIEDGVTPLRSDAILEEAERFKEILRAWCEIAKSEGVPSDYRVDIGLASQVAQRIVATARANDISLLALCAERGPLKAAIMGSVLREVIRGASCPCWVIHRIPGIHSKSRKLTG